MPELNEGQMTTENYGEPWRRRGNQVVGGEGIDDGRVLLVGFRLDGEELDAARAVACVNFLAGVATADIELILKEHPQYVDRLRYQLFCVAIAERKGMGERFKTKGAEA